MCDPLWLRIYDLKTPKNHEKIYPFLAPHQGFKSPWTDTWVMKMCASISWDFWNYKTWYCVFEVSKKNIYIYILSHKVGFFLRMGPFWLQFCFSLSNNQTDVWSLKSQVLFKLGSISVSQYLMFFCRCKKKKISCSVLKQKPPYIHVGFHVWFYWETVGRGANYLTGIISWHFRFAKCICSGNLCSFSSRYCWWKKSCASSGIF